MSNQAISRIVTVIVVFALYSATMCRWIGAGDTAIVVWNMSQRILSTHVNNHAAMVGFGWLLIEYLPWGEPAWRANWFSVIFQTGTIFMFHLVASRIIKHPIHTFLASLVVAVTHTIWWHATIVENYALNGVMLLLVTWMLMKDHETKDIRWMYAASIPAGLAILNHAQMGFLAPILGAYAAARDPWQTKTVIKRWVLLASGWFVGLIPYFILMRYNIEKSRNTERVVKDAMGSYFTEIMFDLKLGQIGTIFWREVIQQFPSPVLVLIPVGIWAAFRWSDRARVHVGLLAGFVINSGFFMAYNTWDRYAFLMPSYLILLLWLTEGWAWALEKAETERPRLERVIYLLAVLSIAMPPVFYRELPRIAKAGWFWPGRFTSNGLWNTHDVATYLANPDKSGWNDLARFNEALLDKLPRRATVVDDDGRNHYTLNLYYQNVLQQRRDVRALLVNAWGFEGWGQDKEKVPEKLLRFRKQAPVYSVTLMPPHRTWQIALSEEGLGPNPFYVADDLWIYRFDERPRGSEEPFFWEIHTGYHLRSGTGVMSWQLGPNDKGQVRIRYKQTTEAHTSTLRYTSPSGEVVEQEIEIEAEAVRSIVEIPEEVMSSPGRWKIEIVHEGQVDTYLYLQVQDHPVDRRFR